MRGGIPKDPALRQRRNKETKTALSEVAVRHRAPRLPKRKEGLPDWEQKTKEWWHDIWHSPMAEQYLRADVHGLYRLLELIDAFWQKPDAKLGAEIRLQQANFGLTPLDRMRLRWEVERVKAVAQEHKRPQSPRQKDDPRKLLSLIQ